MVSLFASGGCLGRFASGGSCRRGRPTGWPPGWHLRFFGKERSCTGVEWARAPAMRASLPRRFPAPRLRCAAARVRRPPTSPRRRPASPHSILAALAPGFPAPGLAAPAPCNPISLRRRAALPAPLHLRPAPCTSASCACAPLPAPRSRCTAPVPLRPGFVAPAPGFRTPTSLRPAPCNPISLRRRAAPPAPAAPAPAPCTSASLRLRPLPRLLVPALAVRPSASEQRGWACRFEGVVRVQAGACFAGEAE